MTLRGGLSAQGGFYRIEGQNGSLNFGVRRHVGRP